MSIKHRLEGKVCIVTKNSLKSYGKKVLVDKVNFGMAKCTVIDGGKVISIGIENLEPVASELEGHPDIVGFAMLVGDQEFHDLTKNEFSKNGFYFERCMLFPASNISDAVAWLNKNSSDDVDPNHYDYILCGGKLYPFEVTTKPTVHLLDDEE